IISSCASKPTMSEDSVQSNTAIGNRGEFPEVSPEESAQADADSDIGGIEPEKVITSVFISLETTEFDSAIENLGSIVSKSKGYVENSNISSRGRINNKVFQHAQYTIRIPKGSVDTFTGEMDSIGNVVSQSTSKEDITKQYYDTESRLNLLKVKEERMTALLKKAERIEDIITIENQLSEIIHQKESMTKNILEMDDKVAYSIINMEISEVEKLRSDVTAKTTFAARISNAFNDSLYTFKVFVEGVVLIFVYTWPFLLVGGLIAFLVFKFIKTKRETK
ncbi:MAG TPA: DUF4349 domain-containing protein, partial [Clostridia bacterium]|nr:DUF4349 domain-containing protein [Clostridia bacterium]